MVLRGLMQLKFLNDCVGIRRSSANAVVYREMGMCSVWAGWTRRAAGLRNRAVRRDPSDMVRLAVAESCGMVEGGARGGWAAQLSDSIHRVAAGLGMDWRLDRRGLAALPASLVQGGTEEWWRLSLGGAVSRLMANDWVAVPVRQVPERESDGWDQMARGSCIIGGSGLTGGMWL